MTKEIENVLEQANKNIEAQVLLEVSQDLIKKGIIDLAKKYMERAKMLLEKEKTI